MSKLKNGKLVAVRDQNNNIFCIVIPKEGDEKCIVDHNIQYQVGNNTYQNEITNPDFDTDSSEHTFWTPIQSFSIFGCGDLAFYATILGRENSST